MPSRAHHIDRAERLLDSWAHPETLLEAAVLAVAHAAVAWVRHDAGYADREVTR